VSGITAHLVSGPAGSGKTGLIVRLVTERGRWLGFINALDARHAHHMLRPAPFGCPCCTGRVAMQVELTRALRETRPRRVLIEVLSTEHLAEVQRALRGEPLGRYLSLGRPLCLPGDAELAADALGRF
jgi:G3E family GTPase